MKPQLKETIANGEAYIASLFEMIKLLDLTIDPQRAQAHDMLDMICDMQRFLKELQTKENPAAQNGFNLKEALSTAVRDY